MTYDVESVRATVDLTMLDCSGARCEPLDMGTPFDFFDTMANTASPKASDAQRANRMQLVEAMDQREEMNEAMAPAATRVARPRM